VSKEEITSLSSQEKRFLCQLARKTLERQFNDKIFYKKPEAAGKLGMKKSVFVTLWKHGELRGCIGSLAKDKNLVDAVEDLTVKSAFSDPRFTDLKEDELKDIEIEISILSDLTEIKKIEEIEIGRHGLFVQKESFSGLLLPQVADEEQWDRETFLKNTCMKAGLDANAWKKGARIFMFSALKFSEDGMDSD